MYPLAILTALLAVLGTYNLATYRSQSEAFAVGRSDALAQNLVTYRNLVAQFVATQPAGYTAPGVNNAVPDASLALPGWYLKDGRLRNAVVAGVVTIYTNGATPREPFVQQALVDRLNGMALVGSRTTAGTAVRYGEVSTTFSVPAYVPASSIVISTKVH